MKNYTQRHDHNQTQATKDGSETRQHSLISTRYVSEQPETNKGDSGGLIKHNHCHPMGMQRNQNEQPGTNMETLVN